MYICFLLFVLYSHFYTSMEYRETDKCCMCAFIIKGTMFYKVQSWIFIIMHGFITCNINIKPDVRVSPLFIYEWIFCSYTYVPKLLKRSDISVTLSLGFLIISHISKSHISSRGFTSVSSHPPWKRVLSESDGMIVEPVEALGST